MAKEMRNSRVIAKTAYPRVSIAGNPADGFWGKTLSTVFYNFSATASLQESGEVEVADLSQQRILKIGNYKDARYLMFQGFPTENNISGYGELSHIFAVVKTFFDFCQMNEIEHDKKAFSLRYSSTIPYRLGFSGSTAVSIAALRAFNEFYGTNICGNDLESIALHAETHETRRYAGPQDPVTVNREACVFMDFSKDAYRKDSVGKNRIALENAVVHADYSASDAYLVNVPREENNATRYSCLPVVEVLDVGEFPFFIVYGEQGSDSSTELSPNVFAFYTGNKKVIDGMTRISLLADSAKDAIKGKDILELGKVINDGIYLPIEVFSHDYLGRGNIELVKEAISLGAYAKFPGSGGAVFGLCPDEKVFKSLRDRFEPKGYNVERLKLER